MLSMITQFIEGQGWYFEFARYLGRAQNVDDDHDIIVKRFHEDVIDRR